MKAPEYTAEMFVYDYCTRSKVTREFFENLYVVVSCTCDYEGCRGWASVSHEELALKEGPL